VNFRKIGWYFWIQCILEISKFKEKDAYSITWHLDLLFKSEVDWTIKLKDRNIKNKTLDNNFALKWWWIWTIKLKRKWCNTWIEIVFTIISLGTLTIFSERL
jgi:hypothetical protein